ncbi:hypothetical protein BCR35DRAFT_99571 [Leucosporidium creatinivorum]|uniref:F-box domain-containing protein n=1 Tax=Leucosporidium creatinivorum TaxID=106004 RepID=A0A1Y2F695_9BASI|nr:hypothetical protein BCR35DRAFT_99571 [Leucosporidium creatinivorum]
MAVIQDLPPELLYRVLDILSDIYDHSPATDLLNTSLVARAWRCPSQELLLYVLPFERRDSYESSPRPLPGRPLLEAELDPYDGWHLLELLSGAGATVRSLNIFTTDSEDLDLGALNFATLAGIHTLYIMGRFEGQPPIPSNATIKLKELFLEPGYLPPPDFLESLVRAAPFLTRLQLHLEMMPEEEFPEDFPEDYTAVLQTLALQLRHLRIHADATSTPTRPRTVDLHGFVASCTSLRSLELYHATPVSIKATLDAVRSPLVLLATELDVKWSEVADEEGMAELVDVLKQPALRQLKRWRLVRFSGYCSSGLRGAIPQWANACRACGVEPRNHLRFFTDDLP